MSNLIPPDSAILSSDGKHLRPKSCSACFWFDMPENGIVPPPGTNADDKKAWKTRGYCRRNSGGPTEKQNQKMHWPTTDAHTDWCGSGVLA